MTIWQYLVIAFVAAGAGALAGRATLEILYYFTAREKDYR